jgi:hypothetical protein
MLTGAAFGSLIFMSPERVEVKHKQIGPASDVHGLEAILSFLLASRRRSWRTILARRRGGSGTKNRCRPGTRLSRGISTLTGSRNGNELVIGTSRTGFHESVAKRVSVDSRR